MNFPPLHPALVHLPISFVLLSFIADLFSRLSGRDSFRIVGFWSLIAALVGAVATVAAGYFDMDRARLTDDTQEFVRLHLKIGWLLAISLMVLTLWRWRLWYDPPMRISRSYLFTASLIVALTLFQGWFGGEMVYTAGAGVAAAGQGTEPIQQAEKRLVRVKEFLTPRATNLGAPGPGVEETRGGKDNR